MKRNKQGLYDELLSTPGKDVIDWFRKPLKKVGKLYGVTIVTIKPFPTTDDRKGDA
jgi:hypothetical protein